MTRKSRSHVTQIDENGVIKQRKLQKRCLRANRTSVRKATSVRGKPARQLTRHHTDTEIINALAKARGFVSQAAELLGMSRRRIYERVQAREALRLALEDIREGNLDMAESKLLEAVEKKQAWAVCFYLKCQGKKRGYIEQPRAVEFIPEGSGAALGLAYFDALLIDAEERRQAQQSEAAKVMSQDETDSRVIADASTDTNDS